MPGTPPVIFADMTRGWDPLAPPRSLVPGPQSPAAWRGALNVVGRDGLLQARPHLVALSAGPNSPQPPLVSLGSPGYPPLGAKMLQHIGEVPVFIYTAISPIGDSATGAAATCAAEYNYPGGAKTTIVVTTRSAYLSIGTAADGSLIWWEICPLYGTSFGAGGTVTVTQGSATVTGSGTQWQTLGITPFQRISIAGEALHQICAVNTDTSLTLVDPVARASASGLSYLVSRTWSGGTTLERSSLIFAQVFNQNLYLAGTFLGGADGKPRPCVIKVANILGGNPGASINYLVSNSTLQSVSPNDVIAGMSDISGLQISQDGRVVLSGDENIIYYSSNLIDNVWSVSPAGFTAVVIKSGPIHALGKLNNALTLHFEDGVVMGYPQATGPTGDGSPPFSFQDTAADAGCFAPRTLKHGGGGWQGVERYVGATGSVYEFNGFMSVEIGRQIRQALTGVGKRYLRSHLHAAYDGFRGGEYVVFLEQAPLTRAWRYQVESRRWWPAQFPWPVGAVSDRDDRAASRQDSQVLIGLPDRDLNASAAASIIPGSATPSVLFGYSEAAVGADYAPPFVGGSAGGYYVETDDLDLGAATFLKFLRRAIVWFRGLAPKTETVNIMVSRDGGQTWATASKVVAQVIGGEQAVQFSFAEYDWLSQALGTAPAAVAPTGHILRVRLASNDPAALFSAWTRMELYFELAGNIEMVSL